MADTAKKLYHGQPGTGATDLYTGGANGTIIRSIVIANTTGSAADIKFSIGASGVDTAASRFIIKTVAANDSIDWSGFQFLSSTDVLVSKQTTAGALTVRVSGVDL